MFVIVMDFQLMFKYSESFSVLSAIPCPLPFHFLAFINH